MKIIKKIFKRKKTPTLDKLGFIIVKKIPKDIDSV